MADIDSVRDQRALAFPDEPYSAYCKVCWQNVYCLWIDKQAHGGACIDGHSEMKECRQAMQWEEAIGKIKSYVKNTTSPPGDPNS